MIDSKFKCIKPEQVIPDMNYAFSYNPEEQPTPQRFYNITLNCFESWSQKIYEIFATLRYCEIETYMEISKNGRLHFHGYIRISDIPKFFFYDIKKLRHHGTYEIDEINDEDTWIDYCVKQREYMTDFCIENCMEYIYPKISNTDK